MATNFHMHTIFCDGKDNPEEYVLKAINNGMKIIGFSAHVPILIENNWSMKVNVVDLYFKEIARLKQKYADQLEIYAGFEMDYLVTQSLELINKYIVMADYTIGSVHYIYNESNAKYYSVDGSVDEVNETFRIIGRDDNRACVKAYYENVIRVIKTFKPNIVGHLDIIKKQNKSNRFFDENDSWYVNLINSVLDTIAQLGTIIEVNTGGMLRGFVDETYPSAWVLTEVCKRKIPIILSSDAHCAEDIDGCFNETIKKLYRIGFTQQRILHAGKWVDVEL